MERHVGRREEEDDDDDGGDDVMVNNNNDLSIIDNTLVVQKILEIF